MTKPKAVEITGVCPHCGEAVEFILTKKEVKEMAKAFKCDEVLKANLQAEKALRYQYRGQS